jgi:protoporphyrin/coproporphyrin ferrochelatase
MQAKTAVLLMAYGGPNSLSEVESYVLDVRGGRPLAPALLEEIRGRYQRIGGRSPLLGITTGQAEALERELRQRGLAEKVFVGMRHWHPYIREAVSRIGAEDFTTVVAMCLAPQYSSLSVGAYFEQYRSALEQRGLQFQTVFVNQWHQHPDLIEAFAENGSSALRRLCPDGEVFKVLFTAHSLPERVLEQGDPYDRQQRETAASVAARMGLDSESWQFAYQSQGYSQEKWLGPRVEDVLRDLAAKPVKNILIVPTGFVSDHVEVLYDVDIAFAELAQSLGLRLRRSASLNCHPRLISAMAATVEASLGETRPL